MKQEHVRLNSIDGVESLVFVKYSFDNSEPCYEISVVDDYIGGEYKGFFGRLKRAWRAFKDQPVSYTGIYCKDDKLIRGFLTKSLALLDNIEETP